MDGLLAAVHSIHEIRTQSYSGEDIVYLQRTTDQLHLLHPYTKPAVTSSSSLFSVAMPSLERRDWLPPTTSLHTYYHSNNYYFNQISTENRPL